MKNQLKIYLFLSFMLALGMSLFSCSKDESILKEESVNFRAKSIQFSPGDQIAKEDSNGNIIFTVEKTDLMKHLKDFWAQQGKSYDITTIEIVATPADNNPADIVYILYGRNKNSDIKVATVIDRISSFSAPYPLYSFRKQMTDFNAHVSCTSTCQWGCTPAALRNPYTGKVVLTCTVCSNGASCTKNSSV